jgi:hypothetical protein
VADHGDYVNGRVFGYESAVEARRSAGIHQT